MSSQQLAGLSRVSIGEGADSLQLYVKVTSLPGTMVSIAEPQTGLSSADEAIGQALNQLQLAEDFTDETPIGHRRYPMLFMDHACDTGWRFLNAYKFSDEIRDWSSFRTLASVSTKSLRTNDLVDYFVVEPHTPSGPQPLQLFPVAGILPGLCSGTSGSPFGVGRNL